MSTRHTKYCPSKDYYVWINRYNKKPLPKCKSNVDPYMQRKKWNTWFLEWQKRVKLFVVTWIIFYWIKIV